MNQQSRIRFNPATKEIEIEGSEAFVKTYFDRLQAMMSGLTEKTKDIPKVATTRPGKKVTHMAAIVGIIQARAEGISTSMLKEKTGLTERQIWSIVNRAAKEGKIRKIKRGLYGAA